jgi:hypothetical protein
MKHEHIFTRRKPVYNKYEFPMKLIPNLTKFDNAVIDACDTAWSHFTSYNDDYTIMFIETNDKDLDLKRKLIEKGVLEKE